MLLIDLFLDVALIPTHLLSAAGVILPPVIWWCQTNKKVNFVFWLKIIGCWLPQRSSCSAAGLLPEPPTLWSASGPKLCVCSPADGFHWQPPGSDEGCRGWWSARKQQCYTWMAFACNKFCKPQKCVCELWTLQPQSSLLPRKETWQWQSPRDPNSDRGRSFLRGLSSSGEGWGEKQCHCCWNCVGSRRNWKRKNRVRALPTPATGPCSIPIPLCVVIGTSRDSDAASYPQTSLQLGSEWNALLRTWSHMITLSHKHRPCCHSWTHQLS